MPVKIGDRTYLTKEESREGWSRSQLRQEFARERLTKIFSSRRYINPEVLRRELRAFYRSRRPFRQDLADEVLPEPDGRTYSEVLGELHNSFSSDTGTLEGKRACHRLVLQLIANEAE